MPNLSISEIGLKITHSNNSSRVQCINSSDAGDGIFCLCGTIPCLLMHWLLQSPEHQQACYWLSITDNMHHCSRLNFIYLGQVKSMICFKMWLYLLWFKTIQHVKELKHYSPALRGLLLCLGGDKRYAGGGPILVKATCWGRGALSWGAGAICWGICWGAASPCWARWWGRGSQLAGMEDGGGWEDWLLWTSPFLAPAPAHHPIIQYNVIITWLIPHKSMAQCKIAVSPLW